MAAPISSADGRGIELPASSARSASRSARPNRLIAMLSSPPSGEVNSNSASSAVIATLRLATCRSEQQRPGGRVGGQRDLVAGDLDRHAGGDQRAGRVPGIVTRPARTSTAISSQLTPSRRWALRRISAMCSASAPTLLQVYTST